MSVSWIEAVARWDEAWSAIGRVPPTDLGAQLAHSYNSPERMYHGQQHLTECFGHFTSLRSLLERPAEVALALWFHDAVYDPRRSDNEAESAAWAERALAQAGVEPAAIARVVALILATRHAQPPPPGDAAYLVDIDLAILAAPVERFDEYEAQVRQEYAFVSDEAFREGRARILQGFLDRPALYATTIGYDRWEATARGNLARSLGRLTDARLAAT